MKYLIILIALYSCAPTKQVTLQVTRIDNSIDTVSFKVKKGFCIATFYGDTVPKLIDKKERVIFDNVNDYKILKIKWKIQ